MPNSIIQAEDRYHPYPDSSHLTAPERAVRKWWAPYGERGLPTETSQIVVRPFVDAGRWLIRCPWCPGAMYASKSDPRFFCVLCGNGDTNQWATVEWPNDAESVEHTLSLVPDPRYRFWRANG